MLNPTLKVSFALSPQFTTLGSFMTLHVALVHFPITDKHGDAVCTSITNLDLHDISRAGTTYGAEGVWLVHPFESQRRFIRRVMKHWLQGWGGQYNPSRQQSLSRTELVEDLGEVARQIEQLEGKTPIFVGTSASPVGKQISFPEMRKRLDDEPETPFCLVFGTGWGLHPELTIELDLVLEPVYGPGEWNHLSVRAAIGIILDRLKGRSHPLYLD
jgi:hypothetical protein